jgi:hypothetical protein
MQKNLKTIGAYTESTDLIFKALKNYSSRDTVSLMSLKKRVRAAQVSGILLLEPSLNFPLTTKV